MTTTTLSSVPGRENACHQIKEAELLTFMVFERIATG